MLLISVSESKTAPAQGFGAFGSAQQPAANTFNAFGAQAMAPVPSNTFDPFGSTPPQPAQASGFAAFGAQPQQQQASPFGAAPPASSSSFNAFGSPASSGLNSL